MVVAVAVAVVMVFGAFISEHPCVRSVFVHILVESNELSTKTGEFIFSIHSVWRG